MASKNDELNARIAKYFETKILDDPDVLTETVLDGGPDRWRRSVERLLREELREPKYSADDIVRLVFRHAGIDTREILESIDWVKIALAAKRALRNFADNDEVIALRAALTEDAAIWNAALAEVGLASEGFDSED